MKNEKLKVVIISEGDNVGITLAEPLVKGEEIIINGQNIIVLEPIPVGHKIALCDIHKNEYVKKFGEVIGRAKCDIKIGEHVHVHNVEDITEQLSAQSMERN
ncbi:MAG: UxaA family hydrolase [Acetivibrionales bacterium]|jgi:altronate dehydratase